MDIHCGGVDNKFPHHTNEIAQSESFLGHKWCNYWFHVEHLNGKNGKMSKSSGEFITISGLKERGYNPLIYKFFCLQSHYRRELIFSFEGMDSAKKAYTKLISKIDSLKNQGEIDNDSVLLYQNKFKEALSNDLNTSSAITVLFDVLKSELNDNTKKYLIKDFDTVLSLNLNQGNSIDNSIELDDTLKKNILEKIEERYEAKRNKDYEKADKIKNDLLTMNIELIDTREGTQYRIIK